jgi:hypothetical protein
MFNHIIPLLEPNFSLFLQNRFSHDHVAQPVFSKQTNKQALRISPPNINSLDSAAAIIALSLISTIVQMW